MVDFIIVCVFFILPLILIFKINWIKIMTDKIKVYKTYISGLFASLGISALANKIDYFIYWDIENILKFQKSIIYAIIFIVISIYFYEERE